MSLSTFNPLSFLSGDSDSDSRRRMMMAMMLQRGSEQGGTPTSPFAGAMQGIQGGIGNGMMLADLYKEFNKPDANGAANGMASDAFDTTSGLFGQPSAGTSVANNAMDEFANGGQSPLSYGMNNFGQGISNMGYGIGNWFGGLW